MLPKDFFFISRRKHFEQTSTMAYFFILIDKEEEKDKDKGPGGEACLSRQGSR